MDWLFRLIIDPVDYADENMNFTCYLDDQEEFIYLLTVDSDFFQVLIFYTAYYGAFFSLASFVYVLAKSVWLHYSFYQE